MRIYYSFIILLLSENISFSQNNFALEEIKISEQIWMKHNLNVAHFKNGEPIEQAETKAEWKKLNEEKKSAWCYYENNSKNPDLYGKLYNWYAVNDPRGLAPAGYHVSTDLEWTSLVACLGGDSTAGGKIKEAGLMHWLTPNTGATNSSGITGLPAGCRDFDGSFKYISSYGIWWSSTMEDSSYAWARDIYYNDGVILRFSDLKILGFSVRCLKD